METIILAYICAGIAWLFAFYISYLFIYKNISFKRFILLITLWGAYTHSPLLAAVDLSGLSDIKVYEAIIFYLLTIVTVVAGYAVAYGVYKVLKILPPPPPSLKGREPLRGTDPFEFVPLPRREGLGVGVIFIMTLGEYLRGIALSILFLGGSSHIGVSDATFSVANALALTPLSRLAYFGHIYYLTFILFLIIVMIFETHNRYKKYLSKDTIKKDEKPIQNKAKSYVNLILKIKFGDMLTVTKPLILLFIFIGLQLLYIKYVYYKYHERQMKLGGVAANILLIPSDIPMHYDMKNTVASTTFNKVKSDYQNQLEQIIKNINSPYKLNTSTSSLQEEIKYDMAILPENVAYITSLKSGKDIYKGIPILNGLLNEKEGSVKNSSIYIDSIHNASNYRDKAYLFPFYEYKPYVANLIPDSTYKKGNEIKEGDGVVDFYLEGDGLYKWTTMICSEFYSYNYLKSLKSHDYDFIISQSSLGIFNHSSWMHANVLLSQIINSNYLAVPIINVSNSAPSYLIIDNEIKDYHEDAEPFSVNFDKI